MMRIATTTMGTTTAIAVFPPVDNPDDFCATAPPDTNDPAEEDVDEAAVLLEDVGGCVGGGEGGSVEVMTTITGVPPELVGAIVIWDVMTGADTTEVVAGLVDTLVTTDEMVEREDEVSEGVTVEMGTVVVETMVVGRIEEVVIGTNIDEEVDPAGTISC